MNPDISWKDARVVQARQLQSLKLKQAWPSAWYKHSGKLAAEILCEDGYSEEIAKSGEHALLTLQVLDHSRRPFEFVKISPLFTTLSEAQAALPRVLEKWSTFIPEEFQKRLPNYKAAINSVARMYG